MTENPTGQNYRKFTVTVNNGDRSRNVESDFTQEEISKIEVLVSQLAETRQSLADFSLSSSSVLRNYYTRISIPSFLSLQSKSKWSARLRENIEIIKSNHDKIISILNGETLSDFEKCVKIMNRALELFS